ncbi:DUF3558 domain-containing protein [Nocardia amikacinitolerans]|uniref:DUF3558 domain-containing protein n=1 Tax=Nocardia amikacinitolerans TaxID=756689 RepID=UPI00367D4403
MSRRITLVLLGALLASGAIGCEDATSGSPTTTSTGGVAALFNPCSEIPDDALRRAGVDPATEEPGIAGVPQAGWEICTWKSRRYHLTVLSTGRSVSEFEAKPGNVDFRDVAIAGRAGREFRVEGASKQFDCDVVFPAAQGVVQVRILNNAAMDNLEDPCAILSRAGESIVPVLPN